MSATETDSFDWFDIAYVERIFSTYEKGPVEIIDWSKATGTKKGENFVSSIQRVKASYRVSKKSDIKHVSTIVKSRQDSGLMEAIEDNFNMFERETTLYKTIINKIEDLFRKMNDNTRFAPRVFYTDDRVIVLEDLRESGYKLMDVRRGFNLEHCQKVLEKLAKFHVASRILFEENPDLFKHHMAGNVSEVENPIHDMYRNNMATCIEYVQKSPVLEQYSEKLIEYRKKVVDKMVKVFSRDENSFNTLNHGDVWANNILFKVNATGHVEDILFVDYQEGYFGSPGIDLNFFFNTSLKAKVYRDQKNALIEYYSSVLNETFKKFNHAPVSLLDIRKEISKKADHGLVTACCIYPVVTTERTDLADPENFLCDDPEHRKNRFEIFNSETYGQLLQIALPECVANAVL